MVAHELLVEARLCDAGTVCVLWPEPGRVRCEHLIDQHDLVAVREPPRGVTRVSGGAYEPELELGVGDNDAARLRVCRAMRVKCEGQRTQTGHQVWPNELGGLRLGDVLVVTGGGFGGWREDRVRQPIRLPQPGWERNAADRARALVIDPRGAGEVATSDTLDRYRVGSPHEHRPTPQHVGMWATDVRVLLGCR